MDYRRQRFGGAFNDCVKIIKTLKNHKLSQPFLTPVDPYALGIPDYFEVIKRPMDLGTVEKNLRDGFYGDANQFADDVRLIWANCIQYNGASHAISLSAMQLSDLFEKRFSELRTVSFEDLGGDGTYGAKPPRPKTTPSNKKRAVGLPGGVGAVRAPEPDMTHEEKRQLCIQINNLEHKYLGRVIYIIHKAVPGILDAKEAGDDEVEISIESLGTNTLRELEAYVRDIKNQQNHPQQTMMMPPQSPAQVASPMPSAMSPQSTGYDAADPNAMQI